jgi:thioredoxin 2
MEAPKSERRVMVSCASCGTTNYYPSNAGGKKAACGRCRAVLPQPGTVLEPGQPEVYSLLRNSKLPVLVDFYSPTCGPCHVMHPVLDRLARRRAGEIVVVKVDVDRLPELASGFGIQAVPTFIIVLSGTERARTSGAVSEENFSLWVASRT